MTVNCVNQARDRYVAHAVCDAAAPHGVRGVLISGDGVYRFTPDATLVLHDT